MICQGKKWRFHRKCIKILNCRCMQDEIFGPVATISKFECEAEVIERVNNTRYGLCASVWSENVGTIHRMGQRLEVGTVWSNCWLVR